MIEYYIIHSILQKYNMNKTLLLLLLSLIVLYTKGFEGIKRDSLDSMDLLELGSMGNCTNGFCNYRGFCDDTKTYCICNTGYITFRSTDGTQCNYQQASTVAAFLLEFFLGSMSGAGYFYLGKIGLAVGQLVLFLVSICCCGGGYYYVKGDGSKGYASGGCGLLSLGIFIWWLYAVIVIGLGHVTDKNGAPIPPL